MKKLKEVNLSIESFFQKPYLDFRETLNRDTKNASFRAAIEEAEDLIRTRNPG